MEGHPFEWFSHRAGYLAIQKHTRQTDRHHPLLRQHISEPSSIQAEKMPYDKWNNRKTSANCEHNRIELLQAIVDVFVAVTSRDGKVSSSRKTHCDQEKDKEQINTSFDLGFNFIAALSSSLSSLTRRSALVGPFN